MRKSVLVPWGLQALFGVDLTWLERQPPIWTSSSNVEQLPEEQRVVSSSLTLSAILVEWLSRFKATKHKFGAAMNVAVGVRIPTSTIIIYGRVAERFNALVLKTRVGKNYRRFESYLFRHFCARGNQ